MIGYEENRALEVVAVVLRRYGVRYQVYKERT